MKKIQIIKIYSTILKAVAFQILIKNQTIPKILKLIAQLIKAIKVIRTLINPMIIKLKKVIVKA